MSEVDAPEPVQPVVYSPVPPCSDQHWWVLVVNGKYEHIKTFSLSKWAILSLVPAPSASSLYPFLFRLHTGHGAGRAATSSSSSRSSRSSRRDRNALFSCKGGINRSCIRAATRSSTHESTPSSGQPQLSLGRVLILRQCHPRRGPSGWLKAEERRGKPHLL